MGAAAAPKAHWPKPAGGAAPGGSRRIALAPFSPPTSHGGDICKREPQEKVLEGASRMAAGGGGASSSPSHTECRLLPRLFMEKPAVLSSPFCECRN